MSTLRNRPLSKLAALAAVGVSLALAGGYGSAADTAVPEGSPLRAHLQAKRAAIETQSGQPGVPLAIHGRVTAESRSGVRRLRIGEHGQFQTISDSDRGFAGYNLGAGSWDSLIGTLASAVADEYLIQAALEGIPLDALDVVFTSRPDDPSVASTRAVRYPRNLGYVAYMDSPASDAQLEALRSTVERTSPAIGLVTQAHAVDHVEVDYTRSAQTRDPDQPPGLRDFIIEEKRPAVLRRRPPPAADAAARRDPNILIARAHVEPQTGLRQVYLGADGYHTQLHDSAPGLLGYGVAPTVEEHLLGVTGTCLTHIYEVQAATRNVLLDTLELTVTGTLTPRFGNDVVTPSRFEDIRYRVSIHSPASADEIDALSEAVELSCPLYNLVKDEQAVEGRIVRGAYRPGDVPELRSPGGADR